MFRSTRRLLRTASVSSQAFSKTLKQIWGSADTPARLGLAISGGVDSMALASLCSRAVKEGLLSTALEGIIIDHGMRAGSAQEAKNVATEVERLNIEPRILKLDWREHGDISSVSHTEAIARRMRYRAIGRACYEYGISSLLVAHHADDQAETVMSRLLNNYFGFGLRGIRPKAGIPECEGIYGVQASGQPRPPRSGIITRVQNASASMQIEGGGITIFRPLLSFKKGELVATCELGGVRWFEDHTNRDPSVTLRNTIRYLQQHKILPVPLSKARLCELAASKATQEASMDANAKHIFNESLLQLNLGAGKVLWTLPSVAFDELAVDGNTHYLRAALLRRVVALVTPRDSIPLQDVHNAADVMSPDSEELVARRNQTRLTQVAGVDISRVLPLSENNRSNADNESTFLIQRSVPSRAEIEEKAMALTSSWNRDDCSNNLTWTEWQLFDSRYWVRIGRSGARSDTGNGVTVRFFRAGDIVDLRKSLNLKQHRMLKEHLAVAKGPYRYTLPVIVAQHERRRGKADLASESVVAFPSLGWSNRSWRRWNGKTSPRTEWYWDVRYKHVELAGTENHGIVA